MAVLLVLVYHAGVSQVSGGFVGVDVFFVVSGFVITNQLLREVESTGDLSLIGFYGRRAKRLLPAAGLVLVVTTVMAWLLVSRVQWQQIGGDIVGAAVYVVNWVFAGRSVDYLAEDVEPSPVLHYWSLAVEEQFYLIWPLIILALIVFLRRRTVRAAGPGGVAPGTIVVPQRRHLAIGLIAVIVVPSLVFSVVYTFLKPSEAFFITPTRLWELGAGALVALGAEVFRAWRPRTGALVGWGGLLLLLGSAFLVSSATPWPGIAALAPVAGTAAVIVGGFSSPVAGAARLLGWAPLVWVGGLSYSLYLWHWPLLRFWEWRFGAPSLTVGLLVVAASFLPAWLSYKLVESPIRHAKSLNVSPRYALSVGVNCTLVALVAGLLLTQAATAGSEGEGKATGVGWSGSGSAGGGGDQGGGSAGLPLPEAEQPDDEPFFDRVTPDPLHATSDVPALYDGGCHTELDDETVRMCERGDLDGDVVVAVVGDSKVAQWMPALEKIAADQGWVIRIYTKSGCSFTAAMTETDDVPYTSCRTWSESVMTQLTGAEKPDVMVTSGVRSKALDDQGNASLESLVGGYVDYWTQLGEQGTRVVAISDSPQPEPGVKAYECAADHPDDVAASCSWPSDDGVGSPGLRAAAEQVDTASYIDMNPWVCPEGTCVAVYRNALTYRQGSHITATYVTVLTEPLASYLVPLVEGASSDD